MDLDPDFMVRSSKMGNGVIRVRFYVEGSDDIDEYFLKSQADATMFIAHYFLNTGKELNYEMYRDYIIEAATEEQAFDPNLISMN